MNCLSVSGLVLFWCWLLKVMKCKLVERVGVGELGGWCFQERLFSNFCIMYCMVCGLLIVMVILVLVGVWCGMWNLQIVMLCVRWFCNLMFICVGWKLNNFGCLSQMVIVGLYIGIGIELLGLWMCRQVLKQFVSYFVCGVFKVCICCILVVVISNWWYRFRLNMCSGMLEWNIILVVFGLVQILNLVVVV